MVSPIIAPVRPLPRFTETKSDSVRINRTTILEKGFELELLALTESKMKPVLGMVTYTP